MPVPATHLQDSSNTAHACVHGEAHCPHFSYRAQVLGPSLLVGSDCGLKKVHSAVQRDRRLIEGDLQATVTDRAEDIISQLDFDTKANCLEILRRRIERTKRLQRIAEDVMPKATERVELNVWEIACELQADLAIEIGVDEQLHDLLAPTRATKSVIRDHYTDGSLFCNDSDLFPIRRLLRQL